MGYSPHIIAHRGYSELFPENTFISFNKAFEHQADGIEFDVRLSQDHIPVVIHDETLERTSTRSDLINNLTATDLNLIDVGSWFHPQFEIQTIPLLTNVLDEFSNKFTLMIELKRSKANQELNQILATKIAHMIKTKKIINKVFILSFDLEILKTIHSINKESLCVLNIKEVPQDLSLFFETSYFLSGVSVKIHSLTTDFAKQVKENKKNLMTFTCNQEQHLEHALYCQADYIISDRLEWAQQFVAQQR